MSDRKVKEEEGREESPLFVEGPPESSSSSGEKRKREDGGDLGADKEGEMAGRASLAPKKKAAKKQPSGGVKKEALPNRLPLSQSVNDTDMTANAPRSTVPAPAWFTTVPRAFKGNRSDLVSLQRLRDQHNRIKQDVMAGVTPFIKYRDHFHLLMQYHLAEYVTPALLKTSNLMTNRALHCIFDSGYFDGVNYPLYLKDTAFILYQRWFAGELDGHLLRGINSTKRTKENKAFRSHSIDPSYKYRQSSNFVGARNGNYQLKNGLWWPLQICAVRDGAHGEVEAGISGQKTKGAYSVVISGKGYANRDNGDTLEYCGTPADPTAQSPTHGTSLLLESQTKQQVIRVLRSAAGKTRYAPSLGIRYDGLYKITSATLLDASKHMYRFTMQREPGQSMIYCAGDGKRPSSQEEKQYRKIQDLMSGRGN